MRLWIITDAALTDDEIAARASDACAAGKQEIVLHLRDKRAPRRALAQRLQEIARASGSTFVIGDHHELARELGALAHGWSVPSPFSVSAHSDEEVRRARGVRALLISPIFSVPEKGPPRGLEALVSARALTEVPLYALGGVTTATARACVEAGARGVAVIRAVFGARDAGKAAHDLIAAVASSSSSDERAPT